MRILTLTLLLVGSIAVAAPAWVSDQFEITLRTGPSTSNAIQLTLRSGTQLEVLERDSDSGYSKVRTSGGTEGWVLSRYLMSEPSAREQLATLTSQLNEAASAGDSLESQLAGVRSQYAQATNQIQSLERDKTQLEQDLADIRRTAANALSLDRQNTELRQKLADAEIQVGTLEQENRALTSQSTRYWFMTGGGLVVVGIILGLWLPRVRMPRKSRYDRF
ncbi:MAG: TIGR04211 family SH3 domain-containing protein [Woeseiaceae bacterium]|nr:TIGR04211 family SH3 domain-containing protein [Woeseiaceae bacterium]